MFRDKARRGVRRKVVPNWNCDIEGSSSRGRRNGPVLILKHELILPPSVDTRVCRLVFSSSFAPTFCFSPPTWAVMTFDPSLLVSCQCKILLAYLILIYWSRPWKQNHWCLWSVKLKSEPSDQHALGFMTDGGLGSGAIKCPILSLEIR